MKKNKYLISIFEVVLLLGIMTCQHDEVTLPVEESLTLADLDGLWVNESSDYNGINYDATHDEYGYPILCGQLPIRDATINIEINATTSTMVKRLDCIDYTSPPFAITYNEEFQIITYTGSLNEEYQILSYDLKSSPKNIRLKLIDNGDDNSQIPYTIGVIYNLVQ